MSAPLRKSPSADRLLPAIFCSFCRAPLPNTPDTVPASRNRSLTWINAAAAEPHQDTFTLRSRSALRIPMQISHRFRSKPAAP